MVAVPESIADLLFVRVTLTERDQAAKLVTQSGLVPY
jgi:hypothetical protein